jgi:hypothetical protein
METLLAKVLDRTVDTTCELIAGLNGQNDFAWTRQLREARRDIHTVPDYVEVFDDDVCDVDADPNTQRRPCRGVALLGGIQQFKGALQRESSFWKFGDEPVLKLSRERPPRVERNRFRRCVRQVRAPSLYCALLISLHHPDRACRLCDQHGTPLTREGEWRHFARFIYSSLLTLLLLGARVRKTLLERDDVRHHE